MKYLLVMNFILKKLQFLKTDPKDCVLRTLNIQLLLKNNIKIYIKKIILPSGADPKSVVCAFFKQGQCTKGDKCKFSHDLSLERKGEKRSVYIDARDEDLEKGIQLTQNY